MVLKYFKLNHFWSIIFLLSDKFWQSVIDKDFLQLSAENISVI